MALKLSIICFVWTITLGHGAHLVKRQISLGLSRGLSAGIPMTMEDPFEPTELSDRVVTPALFNQGFPNQQNGFLQDPFHQMMQQPNYATNPGGLYNNNNLQPPVPGMIGEEIMYTEGLFPMTLQQNSVLQPSEPAPMGFDNILYDMYNSWQNNQRQNYPGNTPVTGTQTPPAGLAPRNPPPLPQPPLPQPSPVVVPVQPSVLNQAVQRKQLVPSLQPPVRLTAPVVGAGPLGAFRPNSVYQPVQALQPPMRLTVPVMGFGLPGAFRPNSVYQPVYAIPSVVADNRPPAISNILKTLRNQPSNKIIPQNVLAKLLADSVKSNGVQEILGSLRDARQSYKKTVPSKPATALLKDNTPLQNNRLPQQVSPTDSMRNSANPYTKTVAGPNPSPPIQQAGGQTDPLPGPNPSPPIKKAGGQTAPLPGPNPSPPIQQSSVQKAPLAGPNPSPPIQQSSLQTAPLPGPNPGPPIQQAGVQTPPFAGPNPIPPIQQAGVQTPPLAGSNPSPPIQQAGVQTPPFAVSNPSPPIQQAGGQSAPLAGPNPSQPIQQSAVQIPNLTGPNPSPPMTFTDTGKRLYDVTLAQINPPNVSGNRPFQQAGPWSPAVPTVGVINGNHRQAPPINAPVDSPQITTISINTPDPRKSSVLVIPVDKIGTVAVPL